jgi:hypothetical protein
MKCGLIKVLLLCDKTNYRIYTQKILNPYNFSSLSEASLGNVVLHDGSIVLKANQAKA